MDLLEVYMISFPAAAEEGGFEEVYMMAAELVALVHSVVDFYLP